MHRNSIRDLEFDTVRHASIFIWFEFQRIHIFLDWIFDQNHSNLKTFDNQPLKIETVRHFLLNLSVSLEFLLRNKRLARVSTPPYASGSSFNASISIWLGFLIRINQIYGTLDKSNRFHLWNGSVSDPRPRPSIFQICGTVTNSNRLTA